MDRRNFLLGAGAVSTAGLIGLAGCTAPGGSDESGDGSDGGGADGEGGGAAQTEGPVRKDQVGSETQTTEGGGDATAEGGQTTAAGGGQGKTVRMVTEGDKYYFDPIGLLVNSGETVTFIIEQGAHSSTAYEEGVGGASNTRIPDDAEGWNSGTLTEQGATFEHTFQTAGTYDYFCIPHKSLGMVGRIVVDEPGGPAEGSMPPDGDVPESQTIVGQGSVSYDQFEG